MYCKNCGKEIDDNTEMCLECRMKALSPKMPSKLWYLLIFLGIIGGIIGYILLKDKDKSMAKNILVIGVGINILGFISNADHSKKDSQTDSLTTPIKTSIPVQATIETTTVSPTSTNIPDEDKKFFQWAGSASNILSKDVRKIADSASATDSTGIELNGRILKDDSLRYLDEMERLVVSPSAKILFEKYKDMLINYYNSGLYAELGGKESNAEYVSNAADYMKKGSDGAKDITNMMNSGSWKNKMSEDLDLSSISIFNDNHLTDVAGYYKVFGEIKHSKDSNIKFVRIGAMFYNSNGDPIGYDYTFSTVYILKPGQTSPFQLSSYPAKLEGVSKYKLSIVDYMETDEIPYGDLEILSHSIIDKTGHKNIIGKIKNNGNQNVKVDVRAILYDDKGGIFDIVDQNPPINIGSSEIGSFDIMYIGDIVPKRYDILVQKSQY